MAPATRREPRWADLPPEIVETILRRLPLDDYFPFGLACKPWWSCMLNVRTLLKPPPVLIAKPSHPLNLHLSDPSDRAREAEGTRFHAIRGGGEYSRLPMIRHNPAARCCGSSMGWLFMVDVNDESRAHLLNPISGERVELPPFPPYFTLWSTDEVLCSTPASDQDCIVAALVGSMIDGELPAVWTCRPKDDEWRRIPYKRCVYTFAMFEGRLHVIHGHVMDIFDFDPGPRKIGSVMFDEGWKMRGLASGLLAVMDGKLLLICGSFGRPCSVYEFVDNRWVMIRSIGEWVLLMNLFTSQAFSTKESPTLGFRANCIYQHAYVSIVVYSMEDGSSAILSLPGPEIQPLFAGRWLQFYWFLAQSCISR